MTPDFNPDLKTGEYTFNLSHTFCFKCITVREDFEPFLSSFTQCDCSLISCCPGVVWPTVDWALPPQSLINKCSTDPPMNQSCRAIFPSWDFLFPDGHSLCHVYHVVMNKMMSCTDLKFYKEYASKHHSIQGKQTKAQRILKSWRFSSYFLMSKGWCCQQAQSGFSSNQNH